MFGGSVGSRVATVAFLRKWCNAMFRIYTLGLVFDLANLQNTLMCWNWFICWKRLKLGIEGRSKDCGISILLYPDPTAACYLVFLLIAGVFLTLDANYLNRAILVNSVSISKSLNCYRWLFLICIFKVWHRFGGISSSSGLKLKFHKSSGFF